MMSKIINVDLEKLYSIRETIPGIEDPYANSAIESINGISCCRYLHPLGFDMKEIQVWLRHSEIQTTMDLYTHLDMDAKRGIADTLNDKFTQMGR